MAVFFPALFSGCFWPLFQKPLENNLSRGALQYLFDKSNDNFNIAFFLRIYQMNGEKLW